jgi:6-phosphogluconolactonase
MEGERDDRDAAALAYDALLPERLDLLLLGMGPDGHTASLFPGDPALREPARRVLPVFGPKPPPWRLTLTPPAIRAAREVFVFAFGASKAPKVREALEGPDDPASTPIQLARDGVWFLDRAAASLLSAR